MLKPVFLQFLAFLCCSAAVAQPNDLANRTKRLAVAVLAGEQVELVRVGAMVFGNKRLTVPAPDAAIADAIYEMVEKDLLMEERFQVRRIAVPVGRVAAVREAILSSLGGFSGYTLKRVPQELSELVKDCECDSVLLLVGDRGSTDPNSNQTFASVAWVAHSGFSDAPSRTGVHVSLSYLLFDPMSQTVAAFAISRDDSASPFASTRLGTELWQTEMTGIAANTWPLLLDGVRLTTQRKTRLPLFTVGLRPSCTERYALFNRTAAPDPSRGIGTFEEVKFPPGASADKCR
jgi:hypothetical protein